MTRPSTLRTRLVQMDVRAGYPCENTAAMLREVARAKGDGVDLLAFPEMAVPGYLIGDEWERDAFLRECERCGHELREAARGIIVIFGNVAVDWTKCNEDGRVRKYNACFVAHEGRFVPPDGAAHDFVIKALLPNYREFDDSRYFFDLRKLALEEGRQIREEVRPVRVDGLSLGCMLCEDAWDTDYALSPVEILAEQGVDLMINISCSPFTLNKNHKRNRVFSAHASKAGTPLAYVNNIGIQNNGKTVYTFDGSSCIYDGQGNQVTGPGAFEAGDLTFDVPIGDAVAFGHPVELRNDGMDMVVDALQFGMERFMQLCGVECVVVGISGGIDSAVVAALYSRLLARENLLLVNMPSRYNSATTRNLAQTLARNVGSYYAEVPIEDAATMTHTQVDGLEIVEPGGSARRTLQLTPFMMENVQARDRSSRVLAAVAAAFGGVFTCNANKSEATVGYTTLYGDLGGYLAAIADLWKTEVRELALYLNREVFEREIVPAGSLDIVPSAELGPDQNVDAGKGDPLVYPYHDRLFASWVEAWRRTAPEDILEWYAQGELEDRIGYTGKVADIFPTANRFVSDLERWWGLYQGMGLAKRIQAPPILAVKRRAFGFDHRESQMGVRYTRRYEELKRELLG